MIEIQGNELTVSFPEIHWRAERTIQFQRTLRVPDDNQEYPLPAGLGLLSILPVDDYRVPEHWKKRGGIFIPMYQSEAMWVSFYGFQEQFHTDDYPAYPMAVKIAAGKVNAITGKPWTNELSIGPQDYLVIPNQRWLDGFSVAKNNVRQFVATPLGQGLSAEEQITGKGDWGGLQIVVYPMKASAYEKLDIDYHLQQVRRTHELHRRDNASCEMGFAPGGLIRQSLSADPYGINAWDTSVSSRCFVHVLNSEMYRNVTGKSAPIKPITAKDYADTGIPWFDFYSEGDTLDGSMELADLDGIATAMANMGKSLDDNKPIKVPKPVKLGNRSRRVRDGEF